MSVTTRRLEKKAMESKKISRRQILRMSAFATAGAALAACAAPAAAPAAKPAESKPADAAAAPTAAAPAAEAGKKTIWWDIQTGKTAELTDTMVKEWNAKSPNAQVEKQFIENDPFKTKMAAAMQAGTPPDLFQSWGGGVLKTYIDAGLVRDITEEFKVDGWEKNFKPAALGLFTFDGKKYAPMWQFGMVGMWYNKAIFKGAGVEIPKTWTDFMAVVTKLGEYGKDKGIAPIALGNKDKWPGHFYWSYMAIRLGDKGSIGEFAGAVNHRIKSLFAVTSPLLPILSGMQ